MRLTLATCSLLVGLAGCGGEDPGPTPPLGPALGKRVAFRAALRPGRMELHVVDTGRPGVATTISRAPEPNLSVGAPAGTGHARFVAYQEYADGFNTGWVLVDLDQPDAALDLRTSSMPAPWVNAAGTHIIGVVPVGNLGIGPTIGVAPTVMTAPVAWRRPDVSGNVGGAALSPDESWVAHGEGGHVCRFHVGSGAPQVPAGGSRCIALLESSTAYPAHLGFLPDSSRALWLDPDAHMIRAVPMAGGARVDLTPPLAPGWQLREYRISADGARLVYRATDDSGRGRLFVVELATPGTATELSPAWADVGGGYHPNTRFTLRNLDSAWQLRPDGAQVAFVAGGGSTGQARGLYTVEVSTPGATTLRSAASGSYPGEMGYADGGASLVWTATPDGQLADSRVWRAPSQGTATPVSLFGPLTSGADDAIYGMTLCGDDTVIVRWIDWVVGAVSTGGTAPRHSADLYMMRTDGSSAAARLTPANTVVEDFACVE